MIARFWIRLRHALGVLTGRYVTPSQLVELRLMADLSQTTAALAALSNSLSAYIAANQADAAALAAAQQELASVDADTAARIGAIAATIPAPPAPPAPPAADVPAA